MFTASSRVYILLFVTLFIVSTALLLFASTSQAPIPAWGGYLDVGIVILIFIIGFTIQRRSTGAPRYDVSHHTAVYLFPLILVGMWLNREALDFNILLPGVAWRSYFFLSIVPYAVSLWNGK
jgi:hypothetical protein